MKQTLLGVLVGTAVLAGCTPSVADPDQDADGDGIAARDDCDDQDDSVFPGAREFCDGIDNDCNGTIDDDYAEDAEPWFADDDADGFGDLDASVTACSQPVGHVPDAGDCDDARADVNPDADELCDAVDHDCDQQPHAGAIDARVQYVDADGDGFAGTAGRTACELAQGASWTQDDCDDAEPTTWPGAPERCDDVDNDCQGGLGFDVVLGPDADGLERALQMVPHGGEICAPQGDWPASDLVVDGFGVTVRGDWRGGTVLTGAGHRFSVRSGGSLRLRNLSLGDLTLSDEQPHVLDVVDSRLRLDGVHIPSVRDQAGTSTRDVHVIRAVEGSTVRLNDVSVRDVVIDDLPEVEGLLLYARGSSASVFDMNVQGLRSGASIRGVLAVDGGELHAESLDWRDVRLSHVSATGAVLYGTDASIVVRDVQARDLYLGGTGVIAVGVDSGLDLDGLSVTGLEVEVDGLDSGGLIDFSGETAELAHISLVDSTSRGSFSWIANTSGRMNVRNLVSAGNHLTGPEDGMWFTQGGGELATLLVENATLLDDEVQGGLASAWDSQIDLTNVYVGEAFAGDAVLMHCRSEPGCGASLDFVVFAFDEAEVYPVGGYGPYRASMVRYGMTSPGFVSTSGDPTTWDLHLRSDSVLLDAGTPELTDADGSRSDVGAYGGPGGDDW